MKYEILSKSYPDKKRVQEYIELLKDIKQKKEKLRFLEIQLEWMEDLKEDNKEISDFIWETREGDVLYIPDMEDEHLKNIVSLFEKQELMLPGNIIKEVARRSIQ